jgi:solute carrier family 30 (zinc transporter), member 5/7
MNTSQLLLVSSLGLGVNLFGMFAMGGHHHGHSHSHGHTHEHSSGHSHSHGHTHEHSSGHSHTAHSPDSDIRHLEESHCHSHEEVHSHTHDHGHDHSRHNEGSNHDHGHGHHHIHQPIGHSRNGQTHSQPMAHSPHIDGDPPSVKIEEPPVDPTLSVNRQKRRSFPGPALQIGAAGDIPTSKSQIIAHLSPAVAKSLSSASSGNAMSPITPSYHFGHDEHYETHHHDAHVPNLHDHSHVHEHHEGHSHNMRGVFLHVMAVRSSLLNHTHH